MNVSSYNCCLPNKTEFKQIDYLSSLFKLIGEENRLKLLCLLRQGEYCVCEIFKAFGMSQSLVSHHLSDLKEAGLVLDKKAGRQVYYSLSKKGQELSNIIFSLRKEIQ